MKTLKVYVDDKEVAQTTSVEMEFEANYDHSERTYKNQHISTLITFNGQFLAAI